MMQAQTLTGDACSYCAAQTKSGAGHAIEPCPRCMRPMMLWPSILQRPPRTRRSGLLDVATSAYGMGTVALFLTFLLSSMDAFGFVKAFTILLFIIGSVLAVDGILALRTGIDRTWKKLRVGKTARLLGGGKLLSSAVALALVITGICL